MSASPFVKSTGGGVKTSSSAWSAAPAQNISIFVTFRQRNYESRDLLLTGFLYAVLPLGATLPQRFHNIQYTIYRTDQSKTVIFIGLATSCSQIQSPWLGDIIDSGIGFSYRPASRCSLAGLYDNLQGLWIRVLVLLRLSLGRNMDLGRSEISHGSIQTFIYRRPTLYPLEIAVDFLKSL